MIYRPRVYTASKLHHYKLWRHLHTDPEWEFVEFTASWVGDDNIYTEINSEQPGPEIFREGWIKDINEIRASDFLLLYAVKEYGLRGALVEAGVALGNGIPVLAVGLEHEHTWTFHPGVKRFPSLREARDHLYRYTTMVPPSRRKKGTSHE